jgi:predicted MFS family arabinose efflux permease
MLDALASARRRRPERETLGDEADVLGSLLAFGAALRSPFALLMVVWFGSNLGLGAVFALYPLLMEHVFRIAPGPSSLLLAVTTGLMMVLYSPASLLAARIGEARALQAALAARLVGLVSLVALGAVSFAGREWLAVVAFTVVQLTWPLLSVTGTVLASNLSPIGEGEGMGIYNATTALASMLGAAVGGLAAGWWGYNAAC